MGSRDSSPKRNCRQPCRSRREGTTTEETEALPRFSTTAGGSESSQSPKPEEAVGFDGPGDAEATAWERTVRSNISTTTASLLPLVVTPLAYHVLQKLRCAYQSRRWGVRPPVLLHGPAGSGKSSYIRWLSHLMGMRQPPACLFLDQQTEAKALVGSWVCGSRVGEFEWQEGILSRCVREGRWVVIEQLQQLTHDVHALLHGLATTGFLSIHEQQRQMRAHPDFALFATFASPLRDRRGKALESQTQNTEEALNVALTCPPPHLPPLLESWVLLHVPAPSAADILHIVSKAFPSVSPIVSRLLLAFQAACAVATAGVVSHGQPPPRAVRLPQLRDFLKLCRRLEKLAINNSIFSGFLTDRLKMRIVQEGAAVLLGHINDRQLRFRAAVAFGVEWGVQEEQVEALLFAHKPTIKDSAAVLYVGPYSLPKFTQKKPVAISQSREQDDILDLEGIGGAQTAAASQEGAAADSGEGMLKPRGTDLLTGQQLRLLQQAGGALCCGEPLLFVGDTGAGKTFIVSFLAAKVGVDCVVVNLHQQSESEDLLGRWVPRHPPREAECLWDQLITIATDMLNPWFDQDKEEGECRSGEAPKVNRKQQEGDKLIEAARQMMRQVKQRATRLLQHEAYVALLRLAIAANTALLQLLRKRGNRLPAVAPLQHQKQQRTTAAELLSRCKELQASGMALLKDPALSDCSAAAPRNYDSIVEACGLRDFLPAVGDISAGVTALVEYPKGVARRRPRCQLHFAFREGPLVEALRTGKWLLLDEINLAPPDLLQRLLGLLDDPDQPLLLLEGGKPRLVPRHPNFRVFACMNPPTLAPVLRLSEHKMSFEESEEALTPDCASYAKEKHKQQEMQQKGKKFMQDGAGGVGKRELPLEVRQRFTELYVDETDNLEDITAIADAHLRQLSADPPSRLVAEVYIHLRRLGEAGQLLDGNNKTPSYSLRTLSRALLHAAAIAQRPLRPLQLRLALREGFAALFGSSLDAHSADRVESVLTRAFRSPRQEGPTTGSSKGAAVSAPRIPRAAAAEVSVELLPCFAGESYVAVEGFLIHRGTEAIDLASLKKSFVLTPRAQVYLRRVVRLLSGSRCALLLEGPTSCGKTSLVSFLAGATGHKCVRINNHEHTDIQEYIGSYAPDAAGRLVFTEGPLTLAVRHGWWILIDELNLAPSEVLEALNRLLDGNRELLLPPTGAVIKAHPDFQLFGTQNPAGLGLYGGRKVLSKALANRFLQLELEGFGIEDLRLILTSRCKLPASRAEPMLKVFSDLQQRRAKSSVFFGSHGFMTIRDLIRWGRRIGNSPFQHQLQQKQQQRVHEFAPTSLEEVALEGWLLVGERLRNDEERTIVRESLEKHCLKSTPTRPKSLVVSFAADPYVAAFRRLLEAKMEFCLQLQRAAAVAAAAAAAAAARAENLKNGPEDRRREAEVAAALASARADAAAFAAPELPAFLPFSFNAASLRLLALTLRALAASENLLLVGETGTGKTAVCELIAWTLQPLPQQQQQQQQGKGEGLELEHLLMQRLSPSGMYAYNCHLQMEASELLGSMHPVHQGEMLEQQQQAAAMQSALLQLLEETPVPEDLLPDWLSLLQRLAAVAAVTDTEIKCDRLKRRCSAAQAGLLRFHELLRRAASDVLICLRASRDRIEQQQQQPLQEEDACFFSRALRKAAKVAIKELQKEIEEQAAQALEHETQLQSQVAAAEERLQQQQQELRRLTVQDHQLEREKETSTDRPDRKAQQQGHQPGSRGKRQRKGSRNRAEQDGNCGASAEEKEATEKRRRKAMEISSSVDSSCSLIDAADLQDGKGAAAVAESAAAAAAAVKEAERNAAQQAAACAAAVTAREDVEAAAKVTMTLINRFTQQLHDKCALWLSACSKTRRLFCWKDGPLVRAMREGAIFLLDEASLSQDAVLERLNSVLEDGRHLFLTEQGAAGAASAAGADWPAAAKGVVNVVAAPGFRFIATMNPGGDYGKRELSPALRNRLTEVYVPAFSFEAPDAALLLLQRLKHTLLRGLDLPHAVEAIVRSKPSQEHQLLQQELRFLQQQQREAGSEPDLPLTFLAQRLVVIMRWAQRHLRQPLSIRDAICWICFIDRFVAAQLALQAQPGARPTNLAVETAAATVAKWVVQGFVHGGCLLLLDGLGVGADMQLTQGQLDTLAKDYVSAESDWHKAIKALCTSPKQRQQQQQQLELLQERLQQQLEEAAAEPARRPQLAILWLLLTQACHLYREFGLHQYPEQEKHQHEQEQRLNGPSWSDICTEFGTDGFAWVADAFTACQERLREAGNVHGVADVQIGPFSIAAFKRPTTQQGIRQGFQQQQSELTQVIDSPSVQRSLGRLLRCLLLIQQQQQEGRSAAGSNFNSSGRHAVLLEGAPGAGKTFVVNVLARLCGRRLVRINLSEDTELADLLGSFVPAAVGDGCIDEVAGSGEGNVLANSHQEGPEGPTEKIPQGSKQKRPPFVWTDGVLTRHLRAGDWILLDELNLAPQQTLEGLNPLLDHRRCVYLPTADDPGNGGSIWSSSRDESKKGTVVYAPPGFVLFATQNPHATAVAAGAARPCCGSEADRTPQSKRGGHQQKELGDIFRFLELPGDSVQHTTAAGSKTKAGAPVSKAVGGRKGLPKSLLNRFCRIRVDDMLESDMVAIAYKLFCCLELKSHQQQQQEKQPQLVESVVVLPNARKEQSPLETSCSLPKKLLSACAVRCVRLMGKLAAERPFKGLGDTAYNLRDVTRVINLVAYKLPCADPRTSVAIALLSRLRWHGDSTAAACLVAQCFPPKLFELLRGQQKPENQQHQLQQQQNPMALDTIAFDAVSALMHWSVAPAAVLATAKTQRLLAVQQWYGSLGAAVPMDLLFDGETGRVSLGGMLLCQEAAAAAANKTFHFAGDQQQKEGRHCRLLLHSQRRCVAAMATALTAGFPVLVTGERGGGKSSIVRWLAAAWGAEVCEVQLAPSIDTSDLLGFYRQVTPRQRLLQAAQEADETAELLLCSFQRQQREQELLVPSLEGLRSTAAEARELLIESTGSETAKTTVNEQIVQADEQLSVLHGSATATAALLDGCLAAAGSCLHSQRRVGSSSLQTISLAEVQHRCSHARRLLHHGCALGGFLGNIRQHIVPAEAGGTADGITGEDDEAAQFEWVDSALVAAVREGRWLLLRDAHLCNPSVLDRLNCLLEDGGSLLLTEGGSPRLVTKHSAFRVVLTADAAKVHMLSAALRNRCCEIYMHPAGTGAFVEVQATASSISTGRGSAAEINSSSDVTGPRNSDVVSHAATKCRAVANRRPLMQGLTQRLLQTLAAQLRRAVVTAGSAAGSTALDALLGRWASSLFAAEVDRARDAQAAPAAAAATLQVLGVFIEFLLQYTQANGTTAVPVRLCPLLLQDGYRLLLAGDAGTDDLSLAAAEAMALHHAAVQVLVQVLGQQRALVAFAEMVEFSLSPRTLQKDTQQTQQPSGNDPEAVGGVAADVAAETIRALKDSQGKFDVLTGLYGLQSLARRVAGESCVTATAAAAASWRCLQSWGSAYAAACATSATAEDAAASAGSTTAASSSSAKRTGGAVDGVSLERIFQCFMWQYTAVLDSSALWRVVLLHLLAACCCCCCSTVAAVPVVVGQTTADISTGGSKDRRAWPIDWAVLRGAIQRHVLHQRNRSSCAGWGVLYQSVTREESLLGSAFAEFLRKANSGLSSIAAATRHFLWGAANRADLTTRLEVLLQLQREETQLWQQQQRTALQYLAKACSAVHQDGEETALLPPVAAKAVAATAIGVTPTHGLSLLYAAARLVAVGSICSLTPEGERAGLLLQQVVRLLRLKSTALLLPERLCLLGQQDSSRKAEPANCSSICTAACPVCSEKLSDIPYCLLSLLALEKEEQEGLSDTGLSTVQTAPQLMARIFNGLRQVANESVAAASALLLSSSGGTPAAAPVAAGQAEQLRHLARCFKSWIALLQFLCLPLCWRCHDDVDTATQQRSSVNGRPCKRQKRSLRSKVKRLMVALGEALTLRVSALAAGLRDFVKAKQLTAAAITELGAGGGTTMAEAGSTTTEFVSVELLTPLLHLHSEIVHDSGHVDANSLVEPLAVRKMSLLFPLDEQQKQPQALLATCMPAGVSGSTSVSLLPASVGQHHVQSVRCWMLRDILQAATLGLATDADSAAASAPSGTAADGIAGAVIMRGEQQQALLLRRFSTSVPSLGRAYDLLKLASPPSGEHANGGDTEMQGQHHHQAKHWWSGGKLPQPRALLPHASALLALLLSSSLLRAEGREEAAIKLERQVADLLLPPEKSEHIASTVPALWSNPAATAAAVRAAAAAEGVVQSCHQRWIALSRLAVVSVGLLQAQLATRAAIRLGVQHATELLLLHVDLQLQQAHGEGDAAPLAAPSAPPFRATLPLTFEAVAQEQWLRQQQDLLPLFMFPAATFSFVTLEDTAIRTDCSSLHSAIPVPPALLEATALLTASTWQQQQQQRRAEAVQVKKRSNSGAFLERNNDQLATTASVALDTLCCMWRTELDVQCNDALGLQLVLRLQQQLQEGESESPAVVGGRGVMQPIAVFSWRTWGSLAEAAGGFRGASASACLARRPTTSNFRQVKEMAPVQSFASCCAYIARIVVEVQEHATVSSVSACFIALQRLRHQLQRLDEDSRLGPMLLPRDPMQQERTRRDSRGGCGDSVGVVATDAPTAPAGLGGEAAEWAAACGFLAVLWAFCPPQVPECPAQEHVASLESLKRKPEGTCEAHGRKESFAVLQAVMSCWQSFARFIAGSAAATTVAKGAAEELQAAVQPLQQKIARAAATTGGERPTVESATDRCTMRIIDAARSAVASVLVLRQLLNMCTEAADPAALLQGDTGKYWRGLLLLLLGRWGVLTSAAAAAANLKERRALMAWRQAVADESMFYEVEVRPQLVEGQLVLLAVQPPCRNGEERWLRLVRCLCLVVQREAFLLRGAALDGCDGTEGFAAAAGASISASTALAAEAEAHVAVLQKLLEESQGADTLLQGVSRLLPLRSEDIPADFAIRLVKPWMRESAPAAEGAGARTAYGEAAAESRLQLLRCMRQRSAVEAVPAAALAAWLEELLAFAESALDAKSLSNQIPELAPFIGDGSSAEQGPSSSAFALRTAAEAAAACSSRLAIKYPLLCTPAVRTALTGLLALAKGLQDVSTTVGKLRCQTRNQVHLKKADVLPKRESREDTTNPTALSLLRRGIAAFPSLPFAELNCGSLYEGASVLQPLQRVQWLLLWLRAEAKGAAAEAASTNSHSKTAVAAVSEPPRSTTFAAARLMLASLLQKAAKRHLAWRRQQEIAADGTATLLQRLEGLVVDRTVAEKSRESAGAAEELFPCSNEWLSPEQQQQQQHQMLQDDTPNDESTQYTTWCQQAKEDNAADSKLEQQQQQTLQQMDGLSELDLLHLWGRAVDIGVAWSGSSTSKNGDGEAAADEAYREALANAANDEMSKNAASGAPGAVGAILRDELAVPAYMEVTCAPHLQAMLMQTSGRLIDASPLQQQQEDQQLKQLLLQEDEGATEAHLQADEPYSADAENEDKGIEQQLQQERLQQQRERARKLRFAQLCRSVSLPGSKGSSSTGVATSFYAPGNAVLLQPLCRPLQQLHEAASCFVVIVEDHPALLSLLLLSQRVSSLSLSVTSAADALTALESLLDRAAAWQKAMDRHHLAHLISLHYAAAGSTAATAGQPQSSREVTGEEEGPETCNKRSTSMAVIERQEQRAMEAAQRLLQQFDAAVGAVERQVLLLRKRQLLEWRFLRDFREQRMQQQSLHFAPFLWALLPDDGDTGQPPQAAADSAAAVVAATGGVVFSGDGSQGVAGAVLLQLIRTAPVAVTDVLLRFLRTSPLGQFEGRLRCMEAASQYRRMLLHATERADATFASHVAQNCGEKTSDGLLDNADAATDGAAIVGTAMGAVTRFAVASGWHRAVQRQLHISRVDMDREISSLVSLARWNLSSRAAMKESVHKTHVQLAKHVRRFDGCLQQLTEAAIGTSEKQLQQQLVAAALALPLQSPLAAARCAAENCSNFRSAAAAAAREAVQDFLKQSIGVEAVKIFEVSPLADLHAFSELSASTSDIALDVQAFCQDFTAAIKQAAAAAARVAEEQQQPNQQKEDNVEAPKQHKKKPVTRQQMQRRFANLRSILRVTLKLPCLSMCGSAHGLFAAALNDASGLPGPADIPHPLQKAAALHQHDTARAAAAGSFRRKDLDSSATNKTSKVARVMPLADVLGRVWSSAAQQWYLLLQTLLECQKFPSPHRDVAGDRDALLGFAAALVLHVLQQRDRCWRAASEYQALADCVAICLASASVKVSQKAARGLVSAAEALEEGLRQARAILPSEREALIQNDALRVTRTSETETRGMRASSLGILTDQDVLLPAAADAAANEDELRRLQHNVQELREARHTISAALLALHPLQQLLQSSPEARRLSAACNREAEQQGDNGVLRVRLQWLEDVGAACAATLGVLNPTRDKGDPVSGIFHLLPSRAVAGLRSVCVALSTSCSALTAPALTAKEEACKNPTAIDGLLASAVDKLSTALREVTGGHVHKRDSLLEIPPLCNSKEEQQQPLFDALPVPPLNSLFPFKEAIIAISAFDNAAPSYTPCGLLQPTSNTDGRCSSEALKVVLHMLQRAAGVLLAAFDALEGTARLGLSLLQLIQLLFQLGWGCHSNEEEAAAAAAGQPQKEKDQWLAGTGLGEGEGARDASDQIEEEWQFDGLKDEKMNPQQKPPEQPKSQEEVTDTPH